MLDTMINGSKVGSTFMNHSIRPELAPLYDAWGNVNIRTKKISTDAFESLLLYLFNDNFII